VPCINVPILLHVAELDERVNIGWPAYKAGLKEHGKTYEAHIYPGVNHGFHNDSTPATTLRPPNSPGAARSTGSVDTWPDD
jgi:dienelactone hydrolase